MSSRCFGTLVKRMQYRMSAFTYNYAIVRSMPISFETEAVRMNESLVIDFAKARQQFENYKQTLTKLGLKVITVKEDEQHPDCIFVEDPAIVIDQHALVVRLGHKSRRGETGPMKDALSDLKLNITEMTDEDATLDGGDVLFTGKEILVGLSSRTNEQGIQKLAETFRQYPVTHIPVHPTVLHLKSVATMLCDDVILIGGSPAAKEMFQVIKKKAKFEYDYLELKNDASSNVLFINGTVVHKTKAELGDEDYEKIVKRVPNDRVEVCFDELYKADGCLTCCSILINK